MAALEKVFMILYIFALLYLDVQLVPGCDKQPDDIAPSMEPLA